MHFCELAARFSFAKGCVGSICPTKIGLNWFMPALMKSRVGSLWGTTGEDWTKVCPCPSKNLTNAERTSCRGPFPPPRRGGTSRTERRKLQLCFILTPHNFRGGLRTRLRRNKIRTDPIAQGTFADAAATIFRRYLGETLEPEPATSRRLTQALRSLQRMLFARTPMPYAFMSTGLRLSMRSTYDIDKKQNDIYDTDSAHNM